VSKKKKKGGKGRGKGGKKESWFGPMEKGKVGEKGHFPSFVKKEKGGKEEGGKERENKPEKEGGGAF